MFTRDLIRSACKGAILGRDVIFFEKTSSTNDRAFEISAQRTAPEGTVIIADEQSGGKGRLGRNWVSPPGVNLYVSVVLKPLPDPADTPMYTIAAAVAAAAAIRDAGIHAEIKWPNDILISGKKTGGILAETRTRANTDTVVVVGIGLNVNWHNRDMPPDIRPYTTSLAAEGSMLYDRVSLLSRILQVLEEAYKILLKGDKEALINQWLG